ncbi:MAG: DMT family transporter [Hyphomicrobiales bacterium]
MSFTRLSFNEIFVNEFAMQSTVTKLSAEIPGKLMGHLAQLGSVVIFSCGFMVQKSLLTDYSASKILLWQFLGACVVMWVICAFRQILPAFGKRFFLTILWGAMAPGLVMILNIYGGAKTDGVSLALMWGLLPLIVPVLGFLLLKERPHWTLGLGALIGFGGLVALTLNREAAGIGSLTGNLLILLGVVCASFSQIIGRRLNEGKAPWFQVATLQVSGALVVVLGLAAATGNLSSMVISIPAQGFAMAYLVLAMTVLNYTLFNFALKQLPVAWVSIYVALNPAIGTLAAIYILDANPRFIDWLGMAVIVSGVVLPHIYVLLQRNKPVAPAG